MKIFLSRAWLLIAIAIWSWDQVAAAEEPGGDRPFFRSPKDDPKGADQDAARQAEGEKFVGAWRLVRRVADGKEEKIGPDEGARFWLDGADLFMGKERGLRQNVKKEQGNFCRLDPAKTPKRMDVFGGEAAKVLVLYEIEKNKLTLAIQFQLIDNPKLPVPQKIEPGDEIDYLVFERVVEEK